MLPPLWTGDDLVPDDLLVLRRALETLLRGDSVIDLSASASVTRFLVALAAVESRPVTLRLRNPQLRRRPMGPLFDFLRSQGAAMRWTDDTIELDGSRLIVPRETCINATEWKSSQFVSSIIYFAVLRNQPLRIVRQPSEGSASYIRMTIEGLRRVGVDIRWSGGEIQLDRHEESIWTSPKSAQISIPGDWTSASYWIEWMILHREVKNLILSPLNLNSAHPDVSILDHLRPYFYVEDSPEGLTLTPSPDNWTLRWSTPHHYDLTQSPDLFPTLFALSLGLCQPTIFSGLSSLRYKESDRLDACLSIAHDLGWSREAFAVEGRESVTYRGVPRETIPRTVQLEHRDDHRLAMAFGVLATALEGTAVIIDEADVVTERSYPRFFSDLCRQMTAPYDEEEK